MKARVKLGYYKMSDEKKKLFDANQDKITKFRDSDDKISEAKWEEIKKKSGYDKLTAAE